MGKDDKKGGAGGGGGGNSSSLLLLGVVLYLVSWFVPVYKGQDLANGLGALTKLGAKPDAMGSALEGPDWLPGWPACKIAWHLLVDEAPPSDPKSKNQEAWKQKLLGASCLTNGFMALAILFVLARRRSVGLGLLLLVDAGVNASWLWIPPQQPFEWLRVGYFLWLVSFPLVGIGLCQRRS